MKVNLQSSNHRFNCCLASQIALSSLHVSLLDRIQDINGHPGRGQRCVGAVEGPGDRRRGLRVPGNVRDVACSGGQNSTACNLSELAGLSTQLLVQ